MVEMEELRREWYVVNTYSGHENKVKNNLEMRTASMGMNDYIFKVIVPMQEEVEYKDGVAKTKAKKSFPGYVLVEMIMTDDSWYVVRNTPGVTGFIGSSGGGAKPIPLFPDEVDRILSRMPQELLEEENIELFTDSGEAVEEVVETKVEKTEEKPVEKETEKQPVFVSVDIEAGDYVELLDGAFAGMKGKVDEILLDEKIVVVEIDLFGQLTAVDVELTNVKKVEVN